MKNHSFCFLTALSLLVLACQPKAPTTSQVAPALTEPFFGLVPTDTPQLLAPGIISTSLTEYNGTFNPEGTTFFYTSVVAGRGVIVLTELQETGIWSTPEIAPFSGHDSEYDPLFSPDGKRLYFSSERPLTEESFPNPYGSPTRIWVTERTETGWAYPEVVPLSTGPNYYSSFTNTGKFYYNTWNSGEILVASPSDTGYVSTVLPKVINSRSDVGDPFISPEEDYLIFRAYFPDSRGRGDLYISFRTADSWTEPQNLGEPINSKGQEMCPYVTTDGKLFIFASDRLQENYGSEDLAQMRAKTKSYDNGQQNIYYMSPSFIEDLRPE